MIEEDFSLKKKRNRTIEEAEGFKEISKNLTYFMQFHNFQYWQQKSILHMLNEFYAMGFDLGKTCAKLKLEWPEND